MMSFPDWLEQDLVGDQEFGVAYDQVDPGLRAVFKTSIARLYEWYAQNPMLERSQNVLWQAGFSSTTWCRPRSFALLFFDDSSLSPVKLLAALAPAIAAKVPNILAVFVGKGDIPAPVLAAFELMGQEQVAVLDSDKIDRLLDDLLASRAPGVVLTVGCGAAGGIAVPVSDRLALWRACQGSEAAVWLDSGDEFDLDLLTTCHPDMHTTVWGLTEDLPETCVAMPGSFDDFLRAVPAVAYVPDARLEPALQAASLVLGTGQEGLWIWPDLPANLFFHQRIGWMQQSVL